MTVSDSLAAWFAGGGVARESCVCDARRCASVGGVRQIQRGGGKVKRPCFAWVVVDCFWFGMTYALWDGTYTSAICSKPDNLGHSNLDGVQSRNNSDSAQS